MKSVSIVARELPGPPQPGDAFERVVEFVQRFDFSDPRIVVAHFDPAEPIAGRTKLLELKPVAARFLCPVQVTRADTHRRRHCTVYRQSIETREGHVEAGREWFAVVKDHRTGDVWFRIRACWKPGDLPNFLAKAGFRIMARRYQRAWHRLAHVRLRRLLREHPDLPTPAPGHILHEGPPISTLPVWFVSSRAGRSSAAPGEERERMRRDGWATAVGLGVLAGMRSTSAPTLLSTALSREVQLHRPPSTLRGLLEKRGTGRLLRVLLAGELLADKLPFVPPRTEAVSLLARMLSGGASAGVLARTRGAWVAGPVLVGALAAAVSTVAFVKLREVASTRFGLSSAAAGLAEDVMGGALASATAAGIRHQA